MIDLHQHPQHFKKDIDDILAHGRGLGCGMSVLLPCNNPNGEVPVGSAECRDAAREHPDELIWFCVPVHGDDDPLPKIERWAKEGAKGFGEHKVPLNCDDPKSVAMYKLAGKLGLPVLLHFEDANYNKRFERFEGVLNECPDTVFIGHAQTWWANISRADAGRSDYPRERVVPGGLTDKWLTDYPNLYADLSAGSGLNACERDLDFYRGFLRRHRRKLIFGTDCPCHDGHGTGWDKGICFGEKMLARLRELCKDEAAFADITGGNLKRLLRLQ